MFTSSNTKIKRYCGLALLELISAMTVGMIVLGIIAEIFLVTKERQRYQAAINDVELSATRTISILSDEIKRAGHIGCARLTADFPVASFDPSLLRAVNKLKGGRHEIIVRYADLPGAVLQQFSRESMVASTDVIFKKNDILMIADCEKAEILELLKHNFLLSSKSLFPINHYILISIKRRLNSGAW